MPAVVLAGCLWRWPPIATSQLAVTLGGALLVLAAGGLGLGLAYAITVGDPGAVPRLVGDAVAYLPAVGLMVGLGLALFGLVPRAMAVLWGLLVFSFVAGFLGQMLDLPSWVLGISPYEHTPLLPAEQFTTTPLVVMTGLAFALGAAGLWGFGTRDVG